MSGQVAATLDGRVGPPVARNAALLSGAQAASLGLHLVWFALLSSYLGPTGLGVYVFAVAVPDLLGPLVDFGFTAITARSVAQNPAVEPTLVPNLVFLRTFLAAIAWAGSVVTLHVLGYLPRTTTAAEVATLIVVVLALQSMQVSLQVRLSLGAVAVGNLVEAGMLVAGVEILTHRHAGLLAFIWLYLGANLAAVLVPAVRSTRLAHYSWAPRPARLRPVVRAALPLGAAGFLSSLYYRLDVFVLARFHSSGALGQFGAGYRFLDATAVFPGLLVGLLNPVFARSAAVDRAVLRRRYQVVIHLATVATVMLAVTGTMTAWRVLPALHAFRHYHGGGMVLAILSPAVGFVLLASVNSAVLYNAHHQRLLLAVVGIVLVLNAIIALAVIPPFSYLGAAGAVTTGEGLAAGALAAAVRRRLGLTWPRRSARVLLAGAGLALVLAGGYLLPPLVQLALGGLAMPLSLLATGALSRSDLDVLRRPSGSSQAQVPSP